MSYQAQRCDKGHKSMYEFPIGGQDIKALLNTTPLDLHLETLNELHTSGQREQCISLIELLYAHFDSYPGSVDA